MDAETEFAWVAPWLDELKHGYSRMASHFTRAFMAVGVEDADDLIEIDDAAFDRLASCLGIDVKPVHVNKLRNALCDAGARGLSRVVRSSSEVAQASCVVTPVATAVCVQADSSSSPSFRASDAPETDEDLTSGGDEVAVHHEQLRLGQLIDTITQQSLSPENCPSAALAELAELMGRTADEAYPYVCATLRDRGVRVTRL